MHRKCTAQWVGYLNQTCSTKKAPAQVRAHPCPEMFYFYFYYGVLIEGRGHNMTKTVNNATDLIKTVSNTRGLIKTALGNNLSLVSPHFGSSWRCSRGPTCCDKRIRNIHTCHGLIFYVSTYDSWWCCGGPTCFDQRNRNIHICHGLI